MVLMVRRLFFLPLHQLVAAAVLLQKVQGSHQDAAEEVEEEAVGLGQRVTLAETATRLALRHLKEITAVLEISSHRVALVLAVAVAGQLRQVLILRPAQAATAVTARLHLSLALASLTQVEEEVQLMLVVLVAAAVLAGEALARLPEELVLREQLILAGEAAAVAAVDPVAAPAVPASSSSSTTSALPQSSPLSHRRSGLHQRVR